MPGGPVPSAADVPGPFRFRSVSVPFPFRFRSVSVPFPFRFRSVSFPFRPFPFRCRSAAVPSPVSFLSVPARSWSLPVPFLFPLPIDSIRSWSAPGLLVLLFRSTLVPLRVRSRSRNGNGPVPGKFPGSCPARRRFSVSPLPVRTRSTSVLFPFHPARRQSIDVLHDTESIINRRTHLERPRRGRGDEPGRSGTNKPVHSWTERLIPLTAAAR